VVLRHRDGGDTHVVEGTGALVWSLLEEAAAVAELVDVFEREFGEGDELAADLVPFLEVLLERDLLVAYGG
jgi:hypothetical protein